MLNQITSFKSTLILTAGLSLFSSGAFALDLSSGDKGANLGRDPIVDIQADNGRDVREGRNYYQTYMSTFVVGTAVEGIDAFDRELKVRQLTE